MKARLGFAVAINVEADIFIADEALAVGDRPFKRKCKQRMREIRENGTTIFFVSHAPGAVRQLCDRVLVLEKGKLGFDGDVEEGITYLHYDDEDDGDDDEGFGKGDVVRAARMFRRDRVDIVRRRVDWKLQVCSYSVSLAGLCD